MSDTLIQLARRLREAAYEEGSADAYIASTYRRQHEARREVHAAWTELVREILRQAPC